jgi:hypothetical protein
VGYYQQRTYRFTIPASAPNTLNVLTQTLQYPILAWRAIIPCNPSQNGDTVFLTVAPNTLIGTLASPASVSDTTITLDGSAAANAWPGEYLQFNDVTNELVMVKTISGTTATLVTPLVNAHASGTPLGLHVRLLENRIIDGSQPIKIAFKGVRGHMLPADTLVEIRYINSTGIPKYLDLNLEAYTNG